MSDTKFTPGLWKAEPVDDSDWGEFEIFEANGDRVAIVVHDRSEVARETSAHLIAAAPELYEALEHAVELMDSMTAPDEAPDYMIAVLAKARGES